MRGAELGLWVLLIYLAARLGSGDPRRLRVAKENLLGNAWKFTGNQPGARIEFGATDDQGEPTHFVRDDGAGFNMAYADKLFGAFQRLHQTTEFGGTGVGLEQGATVYITIG